MAKLSAGLLVHRRSAEGVLEVLLVHPGGPFWAKKDLAAWSIPKGEYAEGEDPHAAAHREFVEELGTDAPGGTELELDPVRQSGGKWVRAWAVEGDVDCASITSNTFEVEWPPRSGRLQTFPEVDRAEWFPVEVAREKLHKGQVALLDQLLARLDEPS